MTENSVIFLYSASCCNVCFFSKSQKDFCLFLLNVIVYRMVIIVKLKFKVAKISKNGPIQHATYSMDVVGDL